jgi:hypothetical protein
MIFIWGFRLFGRVDEVPGIFHVATKFFHIWYIPLIPTGSRLVLGKTPAGTLGLPVPFRVKSMLLAWLRAFCIVAAVFFALQTFLAVSVMHEPIAHAGAGPVAAQPSGQVGVPSAVPAGQPTARTSEVIVHIIVAVLMFVFSALFIGLAVLLWKLRWFRRAGYERAMWLCEHAKFSDEVRIAIERHFGRISEAEAQAALAAAKADRAEIEELAQENATEPV